MSCIVIALPEVMILCVCGYLHVNSSIISIFSHPMELGGPGAVIQAYFLLTKWMTGGSDRYEGSELCRRDTVMAVEATYVARTTNSIPKYRNVSSFDSWKS